MKYSDFYEMDYIEQTKKLVLNGCEFTFPLSLVLKRKNYHGDERTEWITIDEYRRSDNWIWGDLEIDFRTKVTTPHYDYVTEHIDNYTLEEFYIMVEHNNKIVAELDKDDFYYASARVYEVVR